MSHIIADRIRETTTTTGTGSLTLAGAATGFRAFSAVCANNDTVDYSISSSGGAEWEDGLGTWQTGGILARTTVRASSNAGAAVNFSAGTKDVRLIIPSERFTRPTLAFTNVSFSGGSQVLNQIGGFTKIIGFSVDNDVGANWNAANQWYVVPFSGFYLVTTFFRLADATVVGQSYGHGAYTSLGDFAGFLWTTSCPSTASTVRNGAVNMRQDHFNAGDTILMEAFWDGPGSSATVISARMTVSLIQADQ